MTNIILRPLAASAGGSISGVRASAFAAMVICITLNSTAVAQDAGDDAIPPPDGQPGQLTVEPATAERALERTLVLTGRLLLPLGQFEIEPSLAYDHTNVDGGFDIVFFDSNGDGVPDDAVTELLRVRRDRVTAALDLRVGLPFDSQVEMRLPLVYLDQQVDRPFLNVSQSESTTGFGDIRLGFAKTLVRESGQVPDIIGRITWDSATGQDDDTLSLTSGHNEFIGSLSALKRLDPLAVTAGVAYEVSLEDDDFRPGDVFGFNLGIVLAASPTTSLSIGFDASFRQESEFDGDSIDGSSENQAFLTFGIASIVRRNALLSLNFGAGLTEEAADYFVGASLPIRFNF